MTYILMIIFVSIIGLMFGNYATTAFHRIPNGKSINGYTALQGKKPHCSNCGHLLKFYEYLPLLSWITARFKCNYCHSKIDYIYTMLEVFGLIAALGLYFLIGLNIDYVFLLLNWVCFSLLLALFWRYKRTYYQILFLQVSLITGWTIWKILQ
jgi:prepilin signal peptidase PulO-like enzyme (type II secretory pathway)